MYAKCMRNHPFKTQVATTSSLMLTGDLITQTFIERKKPLDLQRSLRYFVLGIGFHGPVMYSWYRNLERLVRSGGFSGALRKVLLDEVVFCPLYLPSFIVCLGVLQRRPWADIKDSVRTKYLPILTTSWTIWPAAQMVNFYFVPLNYRIVVGSCVGFVWNIYLSWKANSSH